MTVSSKGTRSSSQRSRSPGPRVLASRGKNAKGASSAPARRVLAGYEHEVLNRTRRVFIWILLCLAFVSLTWLLGSLLKTSSTVLALVILAGTISFPMQTILALIASILYFGDLPLRDVVLKVIPLLSASLGISLVLVAKFTPFPVIRALHSLGFTYGNIYHSALDILIPRLFRVAGGMLYTFVSELLLIPAISFLLFGVAQLKYAGEDFNENLNRRSPEKRLKNKLPEIVIVLIHGNEFNECQWLFGRMYLMSRPFGERLTFVSVNMFSGLLMRAHTARTITLKGCANIALKQILNDLEARDLQPKHVVLMGHSLGGAVSAYIKEYLAKDAGLPVELVVSWSAPLAGSPLLLWAKNNLRFLTSHLSRGIMNEFCPTSRTTTELRQRMLETEKANPGTYCGITGSCDPLVSPSSALPSFFAEENKVVIAHVGHYNIKVSLKAWFHVAAWIEKYVTALKL